MTRFFLSLPEQFDSIPDIIQNFRNDIRTCKVAGVKLVIKCFKGMYWPNKLAYSTIRKSKAIRSFDISLKLLAKGIHVPQPVAYVDCYHCGFLTISFFVSVYHPHQTFDDLLNRGDKMDMLLKQFTDYTFLLHQSGIYHRDYSRGNILCTINNNSVSFSLVDLNRLSFKEVTFREGVKSFSQLHLDDTTVKQVLEQYSSYWNQPVSNSFQIIKTEQKVQQITSRVRRTLKSVFYPNRVKHVP